jgi:molybdate transport system substrate-binding protein
VRVGLAVVALLAGCSGDAAPEPPKPAKPPPEPILIFVAASASDVVARIATRYTEKHGTPVTVHAAATSTLAAQLRAGARADLLLAADQAWMDALAKAGLLQAASRRDLLANELVLVGAIDAHPVPIERGRIPEAIASASRVAIADPELVPAGRYAQASLRWLGWWEAIEPKRIIGSDVRSTLRLVEIGEAELGVVYATDAQASTRVRLLATLPAASHPPIVYPVALTRDATAEGASFIEYLADEDARALFEAAGFRVLDAP